MPILFSFLCVYFSKYIFDIVHLFILALKTLTKTLLIKKCYQILNVGECSHVQNVYVR